MKKIEHNILFFILIEAIFTLFFFKLNYFELILGFIVGILLILITNLLPKNIFFKLGIFISSFVFGFFSLTKISAFIKFNFLQNYSLIIIVFSFLLIVLYLVKKGYHTFIKIVEISSYFYFIIKLVSTLLIIPKLNINNFEKVSINFNNFDFILLSLVTCLIYNCIYYITDNKLSIKVILISFINPLFIKTISILILGNSLSYIYNYPYLAIFKRVKYLDFIERCDGIFSIEYLICSYILLSFIFLNTKLIYTKKHN